MVGVFFGLTNFVSGLGEGAGKFVGGQIINLGTESPLPWITYALAAFVISGLLAALRFWKPLRIALGELPKNIKRPGSEPYHSSKKQYSSFMDWFLGRRKGVK